MGSVEYFIDQFKSTIMNNFVSSESHSMQETLIRLKEEVDGLEIDKKSKEVFLQNLNLAYRRVLQEVAGPFVKVR
ncbi:hypothetical protein LCL89_05185 [Halobacillus yeomjeoni]|uniref:hypothetical protein n=1 Tax=Halobacillus yeomjeoni TaxID=311194 RepID=UPI001CD33BB9|nr:hypothetical protein [Halobacillus yeomjeoni]MCA0983445.1 hypothetical protein [Halobacillus yeomjeoni]